VQGAHIGGSTYEYDAEVPDIITGTILINMVTSAVPSSVKVTVLS